MINTHYAKMTNLQNILKPLYQYFPAKNVDSSPDYAFIRIKNGKIEHASSCEINAVDHCNISCRDCNHASPAIKKRWADPETVLRDLSTLAKAYTPQRIKVVGGEPLLHPHLPELLAALHNSGISQRVLLVTNGLLLPRMPEAAWRQLTDLEISVYPDSGVDTKLLMFAKDKALEYGISLKVYEYKNFRVMFATGGHSSPALTQRVFDGCKLAHLWGCYSVHDGYLYKCPQSIYIPRLLNLPAEQHTQDGIRLSDAPDFMSALYRYLTDPVPLQSCHYCLGSSGKSRPHTMIRPKDWSAQHAVMGDDLIDPEKLRLGIHNPDSSKSLLTDYST